MALHWQWECPHTSWLRMNSLCGLQRTGDEYLIETEPHTRTQHTQTHTHTQGGDKREDFRTPTVGVSLDSKRQVRRAVAPHTFVGCFVVFIPLYWRSVTSHRINLVSFLNPSVTLPTHPQPPPRTRVEWVSKPQEWVHVWSGFPNPRSGYMCGVGFQTPAAGVPSHGHLGPLHTRQFG